jgi:hypothetical protein
MVEVMTAIDQPAHATPVEVTDEAFAKVRPRSVLRCVAPSGGAMVTLGNGFWIGVSRFWLGGRPLPTRRREP